jgi:AcrR family transcriptional regulator
MVKEKGKRRGVSSQEWLAAGLEALADGGIDSVTVESLARSLGIAKSGFYWHFKNRRDLSQQILNYWTHEMTEVISKNQQIGALQPRDRLVRIAETILQYDLTRYDLAIRQWATHDAQAARNVRRVNRMRLDFVGQAFRELGLTGDDLEMRTMLFVCYHTWETPMFREISRKRRRELIDDRVELLTRP